MAAYPHGAVTCRILFFPKYSPSTDLLLDTHIYIRNPHLYSVELGIKKYLIFMTLFSSVCTIIYILCTMGMGSDENNLS